MSRMASAAALLWGAEPPAPFAGVIDCDVAEASTDTAPPEVASLAEG